MLVSLKFEFTFPQNNDYQVRWNAAMPMINWVKSNYIDKEATGSLTEGKLGLELGSGTGALGIFVLKYAKFAEFYLSDFDDKV